jgi:hypothetical protein
MEFGLAKLQGKIATLFYHIYAFILGALAISSERPMH